MRCKFANRIIQQILETMSHSSTSFVAKELIGEGRDVAQRHYGCRFICRIFEFGSKTDPCTARLLDEVLGHTAQLSQHQF
mmetsp:Transcript_11464/g.25712  ORF Transcript_11464/g.25712 Transcript_11464/m.25712 type:complete len:80 (-) Transcript_11464:106-345(-)